MKNKVTKKKPTSGKGTRKKPFTLEQDSFFSHDSKRRRKLENDNGIIESEESDDDDEEEGRFNQANGGEEEESEFAAETADEKRHKLAEAYLKKIREIAQREQEEEDDEGGETDEDEKAGKRDSMVAEMLQQEQLEESGRVRRLIASRVQKPEALDEFRVLVRHRQSVTAIALSEDDLTGFSASKDGNIIQWDVDSGKSGKYVWPNKEIMSSHGAKNPQNPAKKWSKHVLSIAVSSDGRYLATGGLDRHVHLWDTRTRQHIQAFPGHRGPVSCLTFRQGTAELISGSFDRTIKLWNVEDRAYMDTLFGHQGEILTIDCLRKERLLTVGRDRTMRLWKVPEESQLVFRAPATSLECCCFISNDEFLSGSDDGSVELWNLLRKKPAYIVKNAHPVLAFDDEFATKDYRMPYGDEAAENGNVKAERYCSSAHSWVSSVSVCRSSDLVASGAGNGVVCLWAVDSEAKSVQPLHDLPVVGFVNALVFAKSGRFLVAGVGQEPRLGRWGRIPATHNGVLVHPLRLSEEADFSFGSARVTEKVTEFGTERTIYNEIYNTLGWDANYIASATEVAIPCHDLASRKDHDDEKRIMPTP
ncbi:WD40 repeat [Macleaya cordata]|uniref:WD40 repeat n=1 Tax=Macleaya cordata TaxID=56857 RepID=A0A200Q7V2_MACCD|nr:WD40 repeat [Macleaya cordata]